MEICICRFDSLYTDLVEIKFIMLISLLFVSPYLFLFFYFFTGQLKRDKIQFWISLSQWSQPIKIAITTQIALTTIDLSQSA